MKKAIITGASGMVGGIILDHCLGSSEVELVVSFVRRPSGIKHSKLKEVVVADFTDLSQYKEDFTHVGMAYYCLGVYTGAVPPAEFRKITVDYTIAFADMLKENSPDARVCFLSGQGADRKEKSRFMFAKDKGAAENYLDQNLANVHCFRPAYIYPVAPRVEPNFSYRVTRKLYPLIKLFGKSGSIKSTELAQAIFQVGLKGSDKSILENKEILNSL